MNKTIIGIGAQFDETIHLSENWLRALDEENVQLVILDAQIDLELVNSIRSQPDWNVDFEDDELVIFTSMKGTEK